MRFCLASSGGQVVRGRGEQVDSEETDTQSRWEVTVVQSGRGGSWWGEVVGFWKYLGGIRGGMRGRFQHDLIFGLCRLRIELHLPEGRRWGQGSG